MLGWCHFTCFCCNIVWLCVFLELTYCRGYLFKKSMQSLIHCRHWQPMTPLVVR